MAANAKKRLALDTNLLLDLAENNDWAQDFREQFQARGYALLIGPTVVLEMDSLEEIPLLVSSDKHLLGIDEDALSLAFHQAELPFVRVAHPRRLIRALR